MFERYDNDAPTEPHMVAMAEAIVGIPTRGKLQTAEGALSVPEGYAVYLMFHWPWSQPGDVDSHSLFSLN